MSETPNADYYARREQQELAAASASADPGAQRAHLELARRYAQLMREARAAA